MAKIDFKSIDEYVAACPPESRKYLRTIRKLVHSLFPEAKERISYQIACFSLNGKNLFHFAGWKKHVSLYPVPAGSEAFERQIAKHVAGKGTLIFPLDEPLPIKLIERVVKLHVKASEERTKGAYK